MSGTITGVRIDRQGWFWLGVLAVVAGVLSHIPMLSMSAPPFVMVGMPMDNLMLAGMAAIVVGTLMSGYGLMPKPGALPAAAPIQAPAAAPAEGRLTAAHWQLLLVLVAAIVIDTMKPATLGFVVPGTMKEYGIAKPEVAWLPFAGLTGTATGSIIWGILADRMGRRASILLAAILFIGTSICGAMPTFEWNLVMCFIMGLSAGGLLPIAYALLAETMPRAHRGWLMVLVGGLGTVGGYFAASGLATWLEPPYGWRVLWLVGLPTGLLLVLFNRFIPESPRFLMLQGRGAEAATILARFGMDPERFRPANHTPVEPVPAATGRAGLSALWSAPFAGTSLALLVLSLAWGLVNFGLLLWLPALLRERGFDAAVTDGLLFKSTLVALPTTLATAWLYHAWSSKGSLIALAAVTLAGLAGLGFIDEVGPVPVLGLLMAGTNGIIALILPYAAEAYPVAIRGRGTGLVAGASKLGGILAQVITMAGLAPGLLKAALGLAVPVLLGALLVGWLCRDTGAAATGEGNAE